MSARLLILVALAAGLAVYFATKKPAVPQAIEELEAPSAKERADLDEVQTPLPKRNIIGEIPSEKPRVSVKFEVESTKGKNRLVFYITEEHGYYVDGFEIDFWYKANPEMTRSQSPLPLNHKILNRYLPANETLKDCLELTDAEMRRINEDMGTSENWGAEIKAFGHYFSKNPDPLPKLDAYPTCR